jgi:hypothetical protein
VEVLTPLTLQFAFVGGAPKGLGTLRRLLADTERLLGATRRTGPPVLETLDAATSTLRLRLPEALATDLATDLQLLLQGQGLDRLRPARAKILHAWQRQAREAGTASTVGLQQVRLELAGQPALQIDPATGYAFQELLFDVELYLYGVVTKMGGRGQARLQIRDERYGLRTLRCRKDTLAGEERNRLYKYCAVHASAVQNSLTGRLDSFEFVQFLDFSTDYRPKALLESIRLASVIRPVA